jgi:hypothetical protein
MYGFFRRWLRISLSRERVRQRRGKASPARRDRPCLEALEDRLVPSVYLQINLVSDVQGQAQVFDPNLKLLIGQPRPVKEYRAQRRVRIWGYLLPRA